MKISSPTSPKPVEKKSILLIGPPGGGKTSLLMQFPNLCILDCDRNLDGPDNMIRHGLKDATGKIVKSPLNPALSYWYEPIYMDDTEKPVPVEKCYDYLMQKLTAVAANPSIDWVAIDSLTHINEFIIRKVSAGEKKDVMDPRDWIPFKSHFLNLLVSKIRGLGKHVIATVHEVIQWETDPKNIMVKYEKKYEPSVQGSIADFFGAFFTDMWRCEAKIGAMSKVEFWLRTQKTQKSDLKNSFGLPPDMKDPTWAELNKYMKL